MATTLEALGIDRMSIPERVALARAIWDSIPGEATTATGGGGNAVPLSSYPEELQPRDEWERRIMSAARDYGVSLPPEATTCEGMYD